MAARCPVPSAQTGFKGDRGLVCFLVCGILGRRSLGQKKNQHMLGDAAWELLDSAFV